MNTQQQSAPKRPILTLNIPAAPPPDPPTQQEQDDLRARKATNIAQERLIRREALARRAKAYKAAAATLEGCAPLVFNVRDPRPLRVGILADVRLALGATPKFAHRFMIWWTRKLSYQLALANGGPRFCLDGSKEGHVTGKQKRLAKAQAGKLERAKAKLRAKAAQARAAAKANRAPPA
jgi:sRNA-binding protein